MMLVLSRRVGEKIVIARDLFVTVVSIEGRRVRLGVTAPAEVDVDRLEVRERRRQALGKLGPTRTADGDT